jgi:predicted enzyme related to lactoylglutathione lyase
MRIGQKILMYFIFAKSTIRQEMTYRVSFITGVIGQWIAVMEDTNILNRTYHHIAFKISASDVDRCLDKIKNLNLELKSPRKRVSGEGYSIYFYDYDNNLFELHTETLEKRLASYAKADQAF